ncbi:hypothetical protein Kpol_401p14 [Vanderwaltozyma polyspora DSM 70294]|uniref:RING-type E3 ubiquitin transferase n=1 Tax=Vanderwaltozyma polyspora (strain ATCC 22028 / DSM 70294 / BCRC 21397 / CBS 2163 / NBRC 10782 / NRRL Y-8283 / UCD 57-17) TaxID=436907 RepID=A7TRB1_VANPO|nr:uncharacterized protein Kpol_401p14 [Vanderwaltozyma polyspora DSM 70294]EDO15207.1 hypothetical protein Kpol_401p14 [Vanderwaltozyma polyspora DSM 70294]
MDTDTDIRMSDTNSAPHGVTCRICRGEATDENPLFHPCKCKGSIKYIHESCLMEWIESKNVNISKPGSSLNCDICHYPIQFRTMYAENMPDSIPLSLLLQKSLLSLFNKARLGFTLCVSLILFVFGVPLTWNFFGKLYTYILDGELPIHGDFFKSMIYGYQNDVPELSTPFHTYLQLQWNSVISSFQIIIIVLIHIALYFQYDMIIREAVFDKMILHKVGSAFTREELLKMQLKERFPMMDDETLEHVVRLMHLREERIEQGNAAAAAAVAEEPNEEEEMNNEVQEDQSDASDDVELDPDYEESDHDLIHDHLDEQVESDASDEDLIEGQELDHDQDEVQDLLLDHDVPFHEYVGNRRAQNQFNNLLDQHINAMNEVRQEPVVPEPQPLPQANEVVVEHNENVPEQLNENVPEQLNEDVPEQPQDFRQPQAQRPPPIILDAGIGAAADDQPIAGPLVVNLKFKLLSVLVYFVIAVVSVCLYLSISYFFPTLIGYGLIKVYMWIFKVIFSALTYLFHLSKLDIVYSFALQYVPYFAVVTEWVNNNFIAVIIRHCHGYTQNTMRNKFIIRAAPCLATYLTAISIICSSSGWISRGFSRENPMKNRSRRFAFQVLFVMKCTLKVFTLFFIELLGFPMFAGLMLDFSLFCPLLGSSNQFIILFELCSEFPPLAFAIYWGIGTIYMYWFAKYIGMIRQHIIRPGVLFFIRSPDDPNIKILHDSLIHPMNIQLSRLCLSIFIYAVFIIVGFGFHTRVLFPMINFKILIPDTALSLSSHSLYSYLVVFYVAKNFIESRQGVKFYIRKYWERVFEVSSSKLRLSSFIVSKDIPTERGHIIYRNWYYKFFLSKNAKWSNPDLFSDPKTSDQAQALFKEQSTVHAYFIPDGILMRVPSSDIISRNYVQTLFVPVTKSDKLLKPLDVERIKERNKRNAGEFGYLDEQSTEFDGYIVVYTPPNFRMRYTLLIALVWLFASILFIASALVCQFSFNTLLGATALPLSILIFGQESITFEKLKQFVFTGFRSLNIYLVCFGGMILSIFVEAYYKYDLQTRRLREHIVPVVEEENQNEEVIEVEQELNQNMVDFRALANDIVQNFFFKFFLLVGYAALITLIRLLNLFVIVGQLCSFLIGYLDFKKLNLLVVGISAMLPKFSDYSTVDSKLAGISVYSIIASSGMFSIFFIISIFPVLIYINRSTEDILKELYKNIKKAMKFTFETSIPVILMWVLFSIFEYSTNSHQYASFKVAMRFLLFDRLLIGNGITWTIPQHLFYLSSVSYLCLVGGWHLVSLLMKLFGVAVQEVKDEVYARGRALENFSDNE